MTVKTKKHVIKIPNDTSVIYCKKKQILVIKGPLSRKSISLCLKVFINKNNSSIKISANNIKSSLKNKKKIRAMEGTEAALIKHKLIETSILIYKKLKLQGVGYRIELVKALSDNNLLTFKLGYSHLIYFKIPADLSVFYFSKIELGIFGSSYNRVNQISAKIRANKKPEPYKGKGILYENEKIVLKEGKKA